MMAALGTVLFGAVGFAQTLVVVGALVAGPVGAFRLGRTIAGSHGAAAVTALAYGVAAVPRNAVANGRLGPLVLYALAPFLVLLVVRAGRFAGTSGTSRRPLLGLAIVTAIATAWYPLAVLAAACRRCRVRRRVAGREGLDGVHARGRGRVGCRSRRGAAPRAVDRDVARER